eukprot:IDg2620t1
MNWAIDLSAETLGTLSSSKKKLVQFYFGEISKDTKKYCFGVKDTIRALEQSVVEILIILEEKEHKKVELKIFKAGSARRKSSVRTRYST